MAALVATGTYAIHLPKYECTTAIERETRKKKKKFTDRWIIGRGGTTQKSKKKFTLRWIIGRRRT